MSKKEDKIDRHRPFSLGILLLLLSVLVLSSCTSQFGITGFVVYDEIESRDIVNISFIENIEYNLSLPRGITSLRLSGVLHGDGNAQAYLVYGETRKLALDLGEEEVDLVNISSIGEFRITGDEENISKREISIDLQYQEGSNFDTNDDGVETQGKIIDYSIETEFNWEVDESNLCTLWEVYSQEREESTYFCNGNQRCCNLRELEPSQEQWNSVLYLYEGLYDSTEHNSITSEVHYVDFDISLENPFLELHSSDSETLDGIFHDREFEFNDICEETCFMDRIDSDELFLEVVLEDAILEINQIYYTQDIERNQSVTPPQLIEDIPSLVMYKNNNMSLNLSPYFQDDSEINYTFLPIGKINLSVDGNNLHINPKPNITGTYFTFITVNDSRSIAVSNLFNITVKEEVVLNITENITQQELVVLGQPVRWVKRVDLGNKTENITINLSKDALNVSVVKVEGGERVEVEEVKIEYRGKIKTLEEYGDDREIEKIDREIDELQNEKRDNIVDNEKVRELNKEILKLKTEKDLISGAVVFEGGGKGLVTRFFEWLFVEFDADITGNVVVEIDENIQNDSSVIIEETVEEVEIEYYTEGPSSYDKILDNGKEVVISSDIHYENILAFTEVDNVDPQAINIVWVRNGSREYVEIYDKVDRDQDGYIDEVYWIVPHLSNQTYEIIIRIENAEHLDENRTYIENIYDLVSFKDGNYSTIPKDHFIRVTFERPLDRLKDITVHGKSNSTSRVEIYLNNSNDLIATIENIGEEGSYRTLLTNLEGSSSTFDLKVLDDDLDVDMIIDPSISECSDITSPGTYTVTAHLVSQLTCININADDVILDCQENEIAYNGAALESYGINITHADNVVIKNCRINQTLRTNSAYAISIVNSTRVTVQDTNIRTGAFIAYGINARNSEGINITSINYTGFDNSIYFSNVNNSVVELSNLTSYDRTGLWLTGGSYNLTIRNNYVYINDSSQTAILLFNAPNSTVSSNNVTVVAFSQGISISTPSNFSIIHDNNVSIYETLGSQGGDGIYVGSFYSNVSHNRVYANGTWGDGIVLISGSQFNNVTDNSIYSQNGTGIWLDESNNYNYIYNNVINTSYEYSEGILVEDGSEFNIISFNKINTSGLRGYGIFVDDAADNNIFFNNTIYTTGERGYPIFEDDSFYNNYTYNFMNSSGASSFVIIQQGDHAIVDNNIIISSGNSAYGLFFYEYDYVNISNNIITTSGSYGYGIYQELSENNNISNNFINTTGSDGVGIRLWNSNSSFIQNNTINTTEAGGFGYYPLQRSQRNIFVNNTILGTGDDAIYFWVQVGANLYLLDNNISNNKLSNIKEQDLNIIYAHANGTYLIDQEIRNYTINSSLVYIKNNSAGEIFYLEAIDQAGENLSVDIKISNNLVTVNSSQSGLNKSADISLYGITLNNPKIQFNTNGSFVDCTSTSDPVCINTSYTNDILSFNVSHFTTYRVVSNNVPDVQELVLNSSQGTNDSSENLTLWVKAAHPDIEAMNAYIDWYKNGAKEDNLSGITFGGLSDSTFTLVHTLFSGNFTDGDSWNALVFVGDATANSSTIENISFNFSGTAPVESTPTTTWGGGSTPSGGGESGGWVEAGEPIAIDTEIVAPIVILEDFDIPSEVSEPDFVGFVDEGETRVPSVVGLPVAVVAVEDDIFVDIPTPPEDIFNLEPVVEEGELFINVPLFEQAELGTVEASIGESGEVGSVSDLGISAFSGSAPIENTIQIEAVIPLDTIRNTVTDFNSLQNFIQAFPYIDPEYIISIPETEEYNVFRDLDIEQKLFLLESVPESYLSIIVSNIDDEGSLVSQIKNIIVIEGEEYEVFEKEKSLEEIVTEEKYVIIEGETHSVEDISGTPAVQLNGKSYSLEQREIVQKVFSESQHVNIRLPLTPISSLSSFFPSKKKEFGLSSLEQQYENLFVCAKIPYTNEITGAATVEPRVLPNLQIESEQITDSFSVACTDEAAEVTLAVPERFINIDLLRCVGNRCNLERLVKVNELSCGNEVKGVTRSTHTFEPKYYPFALAPVQKSFTGTDNTIRSGNSHFSVDTKSVLSVSLSKAPNGVQQPINDRMKIVSTPTVIRVASVESSGQIVLPYAPQQYIEENSNAIYYFKDNEWNYLGGTFTAGKTMSVEFEDMSKLVENGEILVAVLGSICTNCVEPKLDKIFVPQVYTDKAIVLVHGFASSSKTYQEIIDDMRLTQQPYKLYTFDYPQNRSLDEVAVDFAHLLESRSEEFLDVQIVGHSLGGLLTQRMLKYTEDELNKGKEFKFFDKVSRAFIIGAPNLGTPLVADFEGLLDVLANKNSDFNILQIDGVILNILKNGIVTPRVEGPEYLVMAGTQDIGINLLLFQSTTTDYFNEANDGMVAVSSAQRVGPNYVPDLCSDYYEIAVTHTDLLHKEGSRKVIEGIITQESESTLRAGAIQYVEFDVECNPDAVYTLYGETQHQDKIEDASFCSCGNGFCGDGEDAISCPVDCAGILNKDSFCSVQEPVSMLFVVLILLMLLLSGITLAWKKHHSPKKLFSIGILWSLTIGLQIGGIFICDSVLSYTSLGYQNLTWMLFYGSLALVVLTYVVKKLSSVSLKKYVYVLSGILIIGSVLLFSILPIKSILTIIGLSVACIVITKKFVSKVKEIDYGKKDVRDIPIQKVRVKISWTFVVFKMKYKLFRLKIRVKKIFGLYVSIDDIEKQIEERIQQQEEEE